MNWRNWFMPIIQGFNSHWNNLANYLPFFMLWFYRTCTVSFHSWDFRIQSTSCKMENGAPLHYLVALCSTRAVHSGREQMLQAKKRSRYAATYNTWFSWWMVWWGSNWKSPYKNFSYRALDQKFPAARKNVLQCDHKKFWYPHVTNRHETFV